MSRSWAAASPACTRRGCWRCAGSRVVLVERRRIGWGASGRNGGFVGAGFAERSGALIDKLGLDHARRLYAQSQRGVAIVRDAIDEHGAARHPHGQSAASSRSRAPTRAQASPTARARLADKLGASFEPWETARVRALIASERYHQAIHDPQSFHIHPLNFALALARDIERRGGQVHRAQRRGRSGAAGRCLAPALTPDGEIAARHVVLAGNADLGRVQPRIARAVLPVATYVAVTAKIGPKLAEAIRWPGAISDTRRAGDYYRIVDGDRLLWGGRITTDTREPPRLREMMRGDILSVYPQLGDVQIDYAWPGIMGYAPHKMPQVGEIEPGLWVCSAFGGHGLAQTAAGADARGRRHRRRRRPLEAVPARSARRWAGGPLGRDRHAAHLLEPAGAATGGTRSGRRRTRRSSGHDQIQDRRFAQAARGCALRHRRRRLSRRSALRPAGARRRPALAACACLDPCHRRRRRQARTRRAGRPDGGRCGGGQARPASSLRRGQRADRRAVHLRAPAADRRRQGALRRRAGGAGRGRDACPGARCRRADRGRLRAAARRHLVRGRARARRAADLRRGAGQCLHRLAHRRCRRRRCGLRQGARMSSS